jgi:hypothetical protein
MTSPATELLANIAPAQVRAELCRRSFADFVRVFWPVVEPTRASCRASPSMQSAPSCRKPASVVDDGLSLVRRK